MPPGVPAKTGLSSQGSGPKVASKVQPKAAPAAGSRPPKKPSRRPAGRGSGRGMLGTLTLPVQTPVTQKSTPPTPVPAVRPPPTGMSPPTTTSTPSGAFSGRGRGRTSRVYTKADTSDVFPPNLVPFTYGAERHCQPGETVFKIKVSRAPFDPTSPRWDEYRCVRHPDWIGRDRKQASSHRAQCSGRSFTCPICGRVFTRRDNLARHVRQAHPEHQ